MRERPIFMSAPMVRATLDGRKTQTRRVVKPQPVFGLQRCHYSRTGWAANRDAEGHACTCHPVSAPYGVPGDRLWVRETHAIVPASAYRMSEGVQQTLNPADPYEAAIYREGWERSKPGTWRPSIHMPRWASRITLEITDVRVERLTECSEADALAEGLQQQMSWLPQYRGADDLPWRSEFPRDAYRDLWDHINGPGAWDANPWVWVVSFRRVGA